jgi:hypothetical protein
MLASRTFRPPLFPEPVVHHGTASTSPPIPRACGSGNVNGPISTARASQIPHASTTRATYSRSSGLAIPNLAPKAARTHAAMPVIARITGHHVRSEACAYRAAPAASNATPSGASSLRYRQIHRPIITLTRSGSRSPELMDIRGCKPTRRAWRAWRRICR